MKPTDVEIKRAFEVVQQLKDIGLEDALRYHFITTYKCRTSTLNYDGWHYRHKKDFEKLGLTLYSGATKVCILDKQNIGWAIKIGFDRTNSQYKRLKDEKIDFCKVEAEMYNRAIDAELSEYFASTYVIGYCGASVICLQERAEADEPSVNEAFRSYVSYGYDRDDFDSDESYECALSDCASDIDNEDRIRALLTDECTEDEINALVTFIEENDINDLHSGNWGYSDKYNHFVLIDYSGFR